MFSGCHYRRLLQGLCLTLPQTNTAKMKSVKLLTKFLQEVCGNSVLLLKIIATYKSTMEREKAFLNAIGGYPSQNTSSHQELKKTYKRATH